MTDLIFKNDSLAVNGNTARNSIGEFPVLEAVPTTLKKFDLKGRFSDVELIFERLLENTKIVLWVVNSHTQSTLYVSSGFTTIWGYPVIDASFQTWFKSIHPDDKKWVMWATPHPPSSFYKQEYRITRSDGTIRWIREYLGSVMDGAEETRKLIRIIEDITGQRRLENLILDINGREQRRVGQDIHDGLCQNLIGIKFLSKALEEKLRLRSLPEAEEVKEIGELVTQALTQADLVAKGLSLVELEENGFVSAFRQLASNIMKLHNVSCTLNWGDESVQIDDKFVATQLYRITQEAMNNSIKHGKAKHIAISFATEGEKIILTVKDDGVGFSVLPNRKGMGIPLMNFRARKIGATLRLERAKEGGAVLTCSFLNQKTKSNLGRRREDKIAY